MLMFVWLCVSYLGIIVNLCLGNVQEIFVVLFSEYVDVVVLIEVEVCFGLFLEELVNLCICVLLFCQYFWCECNEGVLLEEFDQQIMVLCEFGLIICCIFDCVCVEQGVQLWVLLELDSWEVVIEVVVVELGVGVVFFLEVGNDLWVCVVLLVGFELINCYLIGCLEKCCGLWVIRVFLELVVV